MVFKKKKATSKNAKEMQKKVKALRKTNYLKLKSVQHID